MWKYWWVGDPFMKKNFRKKSLTMPKKTEREDPLGGFQHPFCRKTAKKLKGGPFGEKFFSGKKVSMPKKNWKGDPLVSPGMVCYAGKQEKPFWFKSLGQMVQFGAIIFCRTFVELFWSFHVVFKKTLTKSHDYSRLFSKEKRRLKKWPWQFYSRRNINKEEVKFILIDVFMQHEETTTS